MTQWFGKSWGAPCCEEDEHVPVPVNELCTRCRELILEGDQGVVMPFVELGREGMLAFHLDCYSRGIVPHGPECPRCRGAERIDHDLECGYRTAGGNCSCRLTRELFR